MHLTSSSVDWYAIRAAGIVCYLLLTLSVAVGVGLAGRETVPGWPRFAVESVHRFLGLLAGVFLAVHVVTSAIDTWAGLSLADLVVPFASKADAFSLGIGVVAMELMIALAITNRLRDRIPYTAWRRAHMLSFLVWAGSAGHGIIMGTDTWSPVMLGFYAVTVIVVVALVLRRVELAALRGQARGGSGGAAGQAPERTSAARAA